MKCSRHAERKELQVSKTCEVGRVHGKYIKHVRHLNFVALRHLNVIPVKRRSSFPGDKAAGS